MKKAISNATLLVRDYDEAIEFYTGSMGFVVVDDAPLADGKRWVVVAPRQASSFSLLLAKAVNEQQKTQVGNQAGGRVFLFLETDDIQHDYTAMRSGGVVFEEEPRQEAYGTVAVFQDLYGNRWDLVERTSDATDG